jgi:hypothetical protein
MNKHMSRGRFHHVDSTQQCPDCGCKFRSGTSIAELPTGELAVTFVSKQTGKRGHLLIERKDIVWDE